MFSVFSSAQDLVIQKISTIYAVLSGQQAMFLRRLQSNRADLWLVKLAREVHNPPQDHLVGMTELPDVIAKQVLRTKSGHWLDISNKAKEESL